ncbi:hypothetical protein [Sphingobacterium chuzhouense]|uniref:Uncharacterized protein n=1 Tax=Sphingobacterium chuzhouense TaxID=1742264 RepID=A0ABR7XS40_9SPHI|nr:hypothetical protein [Sphingobacterium chuzhouense]MBD1421993.1 hypothetical protein [Sphingobacterium chuzhouense]
MKKILIYDVFGMPIPDWLSNISPRYAIGSTLMSLTWRTHQQSIIN